MKADLRNAALAIAIGLTAPAAHAMGSEGGPAAQVQAQATLTSLINRQIRAGGPLFTPAEQQVIVAKCGYKPGEWDGYDASISNNVFHCTNGRRVDDPEMRALMAAAAPRVERRVRTVMARADVRAAIARVADLATAQALRSLEEKRTR